MELKGKTFDINGEKKKIVNADDSFAYFADGARVKKDILVTKYEEVMDPEAFFNNESGLKTLASDFEKIDTNAITENVAPTPNVNTAQPTTTTIVNGPIDEPPVLKIDNTGLKPVANQSGDFFSKIKRNNVIDIDFKITEKFPDLDFVRMMNDNYETSIIEHFAREIVEKLIYDPESLLESIKGSIEEIVYGKETATLKEVETKTPYSEELKSENDNTETINKITKNKKVVIEEEEEAVEETTTFGIDAEVELNKILVEEISTNVNETAGVYGGSNTVIEKIEKDSIANNETGNIEKIEANDEQETYKETTGNDEQSEPEPEI